MPIYRFTITLKVDASDEGHDALLQIAREQAIVLRNAATFINNGRYKKMEVELIHRDSYFNDTVVSLDDEPAVETDEEGSS